MKGTSIYIIKHLKIWHRNQNIHVHWNKVYHTNLIYLHKETNSHSAS